MKGHRNFDTPGFDLPPVAPATGPFATAPFVHLVAPDALLLESNDGLLALETGSGVLRGAGHRDLVDYRSPRGDGLGDLLLGYAAELDETLRFEIDSLPIEAAEVLVKALDAAEMRETEATAVVSLPASWDDYLSAIGKKQRHELRRKRRRYEEAVGGVVHEIHHGAGWGFDEFVRLHRLAPGDKGEFMDEEMARLFSGLAAMPGWRIDLLRIAGTDSASACLFSYLDADGFFLYNSSYDPDLGDASPGMVLLASCIEQAIEMGLPRFDFLKGDEQYKYRLGAEARPLYEVTGRK